MEILKTTSATIHDLKQIMNDQKIDKTSLRITANIGWGGMAFNLVLDEPVQGDKIEEHDGLKFVVENTVYDNYGPFILTSVRQGPQVYLQLKGEKQSETSGGCDSCPSCG